jgi:hypothetical protein
MKALFFSSLLFLLAACSDEKQSAPNEAHFNATQEQKKIELLLDTWHRDAADANGRGYFSKIDEEGFFLGTDATENWIKLDFQKWSQPYFDRGKAWSFSAVERNIYFSKTGEIAWFDELLSTQMKICRGSGVLEKTNDEWKIKHYVLSMTIPNELSDKVVALKSAIEDSLLLQLK